MSCTPARRASYQLGVTREASMKGDQLTAEVARKTDEVKHTQEPDQQQPSPLVVRKVVKRAMEEDDSDEDNNQEEETAPMPVPFSLHRRLFSQEKSPRESAPHTAKEPHQVHELRKHAPLHSGPPLTTARLRQENAALKLKLSQLGNQHEAQILAIQTQLAEALTAHEDVEQTLKKKIMQLEKNQAEATATAHKCQLQVEALLEKIRAVESRPEKAVEQPERRTLRPPTTYKPSLAPVASVTVQRRGNGSPLPYGKHAKVGSVKPFAWRGNDAQVHVAHVKSTTNSDAGTSNKYRMSVSPSPLTARYVPVAPTYVEPSDFETQASELPSPFTHQQLQHQPPLEKKPSAGLLSYCADMISSKFSQTSAPSPAPNMKVMPAWKVEDVLQKNSGFVSSPQPARVDTPLPGDFTAITMPPMSFSGREAFPSQVLGDSLLSSATSKITEYLSQAAVPIHGTTSL